MCLSQPRPRFACETKAFIHISGLSLHTCPRLCRIVNNYGCGLMPECTLYTDSCLRHDTQLHHQTTHQDSKYSCAIFLDINQRLRSTMHALHQLTISVQQRVCKDVATKIYATLCILSCNFYPHSSDMGSGSAHCRDSLLRFVPSEAIPWYLYSYITSALE